MCILPPFIGFNTSTYNPQLPEEAKSSLELWLDSSNTNSVILTNDNLTQWSDLSGNNQHLYTQSSYYPQKLSGELNGKDVINFSSNASMRTNSNFSLSGVNAVAVFMVHKRYATINKAYEAIFSMGTETSHTGYAPCVLNTNTFAIAHSWGNIMEYTTESGYLNNWHIFSMLHPLGESTNDSLFLDGAIISTAVNTADINIGANTFKIGRWLDGTTYATSGSGLAELIILNSIPTATIRAQIEKYLAYKWGLTLK